MTTQEISNQDLANLLTDLTQHLQSKQNEMNTAEQESSEHLQQLVTQLIDNYLQTQTQSQIQTDSDVKSAIWERLVDSDLEPLIDGFLNIRRATKSMRKSFDKKKKTLHSKAKKKARRIQNAPQQRNTSLLGDPDDVDPSKYLENRYSLISRLQNEGFNAYPHKFHVDEMSDQIPKFITKYLHLEENQKADETVRLAARIMSIRASGSSLVFYDIQGDGAKLQVICSRKEYTGDTEDEFFTMMRILRRGDIVGFTGKPYRSKSGELSIMAEKLQLLSPCFHMLPDVAFGIKNQQTRYRQRYLDLMFNDNVRKTFQTRCRIIKFIRDFLDKRGFLEVETPMLNMIPGGAAARPFVTHHNELNTQMFMRIAPELYLKQLIVGGLDRVYEIGKNFRNEGIDLTHNPEFTMIEFYWAYADYEDLMKVTEELLSSMVKSICGSYKIAVHPDMNNREKVVEVDFTPPFRRVNMIPELEKILDIKFPRPLESEECNQFLKNYIKEKNIDLELPHTTTRLLDALVGEYIEPDCINPTFICDHPQLMSPLAKWHRNDPNVTERFELMVCGRELCNAYTELNSPKVQRERFEDQAKQKAQGDDEANDVDETFVTALEYALPPTGGWGMGIDRLCMFLTDNYNIREVILFPAMKRTE